ncbi:MAG TPA: cytochrome D1 domain-containing protein [Methylomirabilota bacterium]|nr:cytochrome D1 domain-containing protein [Methylomirabilota bacterium]
MNKTGRRIALALSLACLFVLEGAVPASPQDEPGKSIAAGVAQTTVREGISVEFTIEPPSGEKTGALLEGTDVEVRFRVSDAATGTLLSGLHPSAWMDLRKSSVAGEPAGCREKIQSFIAGSLRSRAEIDLNTYYVLALNDEANLSVIDPLFGFGGSKLLSLVLLKSPGEDWVLMRDGKRLFVTMPQVNQVAVVDTASWKVVADLDVGLRPTRLALQPDERYLWVSAEGAEGTPDQSGAVVIDARSLTVVARIPTGAGHHEIAFRDDDRYAYVTNRDAGTLSVIDIGRLVKVKEIVTGARPAGVAFSTTGQAVYVADETDGTVVMIDARSHQIGARMEAKPGVRAIRFAPGGRWGFVVNGRENAVHIFDASINRILHTATVGAEPDQVAFTETHAYIRATGSEAVSLISLAGLAQGIATVAEFPGGQIAAGKAPKGGLADAIVPAPEGGSVLVANPADKTIYYYKEGMAAPMGSFRNYGRLPRAVLVVDRSLRESSPGVYSTTAKLTQHGTYDVPFLLDSPRVTHCFEATAKPNPALSKTPAKPSLRVERTVSDQVFPVGEAVRLRFKMIDAGSNEPRSGLTDVRLLAVLPGTWQQRERVEATSEGAYEATLTLPRAGTYYVFFEVPSLRVRLNQIIPLVLRAAEKKIEPTQAQESTK